VGWIVVGMLWAGIGWGRAYGGDVALLSVPGRPSLALASVLAREGPVVHVDDGDSIRVRIGERVRAVRYAGIAAPVDPRRRGHARGAHPPAAPGWSFPRSGAAAHAATLVNIELVSGKTVRLVPATGRREGEALVAWVWVGDLLVNAELVRRGYARVTGGGEHRRRLEAIEAEARAAGRGLWARR
jgi:endonuclease YncB( thermonuclease family)